MIEFVYDRGSGQVEGGKVVWASSDVARAEIEGRLKKSWIIRNRADERNGLIVEDGHYGKPGTDENDREAVASLPGAIVTLDSRM